MNIQEMKQAMGQDQPAPTSGTGFTPESMRAAMNGGTMSHGDSAAALGSTNSWVSNFLSGAGSAIGSASKAVGGVAGDIAGGVVKGLGSTAAELGTITSKGLSHLPGQAGEFFKGGAQLGEEAQNMSGFKPSGVAESIGYAGEKVGEFFTPGGAEKALFEKGASHIDKLPQILGLTGKAATALTGTLKTALRAGITGGSTAGVTAAQTGGKGDIAGAGVLGVISGGIGQTLESFGKGLSTSLQKAGFKLSPVAEAKVSQKADSAAKFMADNKILGSDSTKYTKLARINENLENTLQSSLPKDLSVPKDTIINNINSTVESLRTSDPAIYQTARNEADNAIKLLQTQKGKEVVGLKMGGISVQDALKGKRSYGSVAFKTSKYATKDPRVSAEGAYAVEQGYQKALSQAMDITKGSIKVPASLKNMFGGASEVSIEDFNKVYSNAITAKNLSFMSQFKKDSGLVGRFFGLWAGESIGQTVAPGLGGKIVGGAVGEIASTRLPGAVRNITERALSSGETVPKVAKTALGVGSLQDQTDQNQ